MNRAFAAKPPVVLIISRVFFVIRGRFLFLHRSPHVDHQSVQEISQELVAAVFVFRVVFMAKNGSQLTFRRVKPDQLHDLDDFVVSQLQRHA